MADKDLKLTVSFSFSPAEQRAIAARLGEPTLEREHARSWMLDQLTETTGALLDAYLDAERAKQPAPAPDPQPTLPTPMTREELADLKQGFSDDEWDKDATVEAHALLDAPEAPLVWVLMAEHNVPENHWVEGLYLSEDAAEDARIEQRVEFVQQGERVYGEWPVEELAQHTCEPKPGETDCATCRALRRWVAANVPADLLEEVKAS